MAGRGAEAAAVDPETESHAATLSVLPPDDKGKLTLDVIELISPPATVEFKNSGIGTLNWEWSFVWEDSLYFWRRGSASLLGAEKVYTLLVKPADKKFKNDNGYPVAIFTPTKKSQGIQILHYNLDEILCLVTLLSFLDPLFEIPLSTPNPLDSRTEAFLSEQKGSSGPSRRGSEGKVVAPTPPPLPPNEPSPGFGFTRLLSSYKGKGKESDSPPIPANQLQRPPANGLPPRTPPRPPTDANEIDIMDASREEEYTRRALKLLEDKSLVFVTLISRAPQLAGMTIKLSEEVKRKRYKASGEELQTFVQQDKPPLPPQVSAARKGYVPPPAPSSLKVFISRMDLGLNPEPKKPEWKPDLRPPIQLNGPPSTSPQSRPGAGHFPPSNQKHSIPSAFGFSSGPGGPTAYSPGKSRAGGDGTPLSERERDALRLKKHQKK
ncbi:hypothetical protein P7C70_g2333, partial [Phenoliferia sp. Uapishka_3]